MDYTDGIDCIIKIGLNEVDEVQPPVSRIQPRVIDVLASLLQLSSW